jgi:hypothetical protein
MVRKNDPKNYTKFIKGMAWGWFKKTGIPMDEFEAEGWFGYTKALKGHNAQRPFKPYLKALAYNEMKRYANRFGRMLPLPDSLVSTRVDPEHNAGFTLALDALSSEAKEVVGCVLNCPDELLAMVRRDGKKNLSKGKVRSYLQQHGWKAAVVDTCFTEISNIWR